MLKRLFAAIAAITTFAAVVSFLVDYHPENPCDFVVVLWTALCLALTPWACKVLAEE